MFFKSAYVKYIKYIKYTNTQYLKMYFYELIGNEDCLHYGKECSFKCEYYRDSNRM